jgi:release factor glutamine methyltransferase
VTTSDDDQGLVAALRAAGFVAAELEAEALLRHASGDRAALDVALQRRLGGEPLAWIVGETTFCGVTVGILPGVYVPRQQTEPLALRAIELLPPHGTAIDVCTGSGAIARALGIARPRARVVGCDIDPRAVACAAMNGVDVFEGDLLDPLPASLRHCVDVVIGVVPYVPSRAMRLLHRDTLRFESRVSYDGGSDGVDVLRRVVAASERFLRPGGSLLLELGADQAERLEPDLERAGFGSTVLLLDDERDPRGIESTYTGR